ncbi:sigma-54-dependent Fis family transcriptional regulator [Solimonas aquatica]|nr:sigma-54-dependent Fis family transcriptional regulator [Solimonas aquatica]
MRIEAKGQGHAQLIESAVHGQLTTVDINQDVRHSWCRCIDSYELDPLQVKKPIVVTRSDLQMRRERLGALLSIARIEMLNLSRQMRHSHFGVMLTDADGVIVNYLGDPAFSEVARRAGFREGAVWSERELGTNGMGTCIMMQRPVLIDRLEHFLVQNIALTCSAAPIFDMRGRLLAALDISGGPDAVQMHTLALVEIAAQNIENRALLEAARPYHLLRFHPHAEFISTPGEGLLMFDSDGTVMGANRSALELLSLRSHEELCGRSIEAVLENSLEFLLQLATRPALRPEALHLKSRQQRLFVTVQAPACEPRAAPIKPLTAPPVLDSLELMDAGDPVVLANQRIARRVLNRDISVLLLGETGTGKGYFAKAIHKASTRADKPLVSVNCAAIPEMLIESELFGYRPGAFTGAARQGHTGRILQANGGTLFLDEIGDMPLSVQARVLSVLEDREVVPLGGTHPVPVDIRIISATHRDLVEMVASGQFRDDLYYRLNGITLTLPPLRERQDIIEVIRRMLAIEIGEQSMRVDEALVRRLARLPWPGNLRQLRNVLRNMLAMSEGDELTLDDFDERCLLSSSAARGTGAPVTPLPAESPAEEDADLLGSAECEALRRALEACGWNVSEAAVRLHISRKTIYRKMHRHGLTREAALDGREAVHAGGEALRPAPRAAQFRDD